MRFIFTLILSILPLSAFAHDYTVGDLTIAHPVAYPTVGRTGAGYMQITNAGADDVLTAVKADFPRVMLHETVVDGDVTKMEHRMMVPVPAGATVSFQPGGLHVMFMGLSEHWMVGDKIKATLTFRDAGSVDVVFKVEERPEIGEKEDHSGH